MRESQDGLGPLLDATGHGVLVLDADGRITRANARIVELFGYGEQELLGRSVDVLVPLPPRGAT